MKKENINFKRLMTFAIVATMCLVVVPTVSADPSTDMVAYWKLDEGIGSTTYDETANVNDGTLSGGKFGNALYFDGDNDYVEIPDDTSLDITGEITVELFVKFDSLPGTIIRKGPWPYEPDPSPSWGIDIQGGKLRAFIYDDGTATNKIAYGTTTLVTALWYHVSFTYDGTEIKIYLDGVLDGSIAYIGDIDASGYSVWVGRKDGADWLEGLVDEVRISSTAHPSFDTSNPLTVDDDTVALWHFDDSTGTTVSDSSTNGNIGSIVGATWAGPVWVDGIVNKALEFDGVDDYVNVPDDPTLDITGDITLEAWIYINGFDASTDYHLYVIGKDNVGQRSYGIGVNRVWSGQYHKPYFVVFQDVGYSVCWGDYALVINQWYHMAGVYDATSDVLKLYINGVPQTAVTATGTTYPGTADLRIGGRAYTGSECYFNGIIDEAAIYNTALSADEILRHHCLGYNFGHGYYDSPSLTYTGSLVYENTAMITLEATLTDSMGGAMSGKTVHFWFNGTNKGNCDTNETGVAFITIDPEDAGVYEVYATSYCLESGHALLAVYDPTEGFVTGGGWIYSSAGAYVADPSAEGKANFGFVSKYKKGQSIPTGNTEFQFKAGDLNFHSSDYDWLVIANHKAKYKGTGTINGAGNYGFMISAIDEKLTPSTDVDLFRIRIWDKDDGDAVVYDNQLGEDEDADPTTAIGGGQIKIHNN